MQTEHFSLDLLHSLASPDADIAAAHDMLNEEILAGTSYPQEQPLDRAAFEAYFLGHAAFAVRHKATGRICGIFYVKPNFPGRCSHICNGGFVTHRDFRRQGVARFMATAFLRVAKDLGFRASFFNLVFVSNVPSVNLWRSLGFVETGRVPNAGRLNGHADLVDALQFYKEFE
jgi:ribosomal protein S18 acetylase RimI-like enzyme